MIKVKKLKSGKFSLSMDYMDAEQLDIHIITFLEAESIDLCGVTIEKDFERHLRYAVLNEFNLKNPLFYARTEHRKGTIKRSEALVIVWLLRDVKNVGINGMFQLKCALHEKLS